MNQPPGYNLRREAFEIFATHNSNLKTTDSFFVRSCKFANFIQLKTGMDIFMKPSLFKKRAKYEFWKVFSNEWNSCTSYFSP